MKGYVFEASALGSGGFGEVGPLTGSQAVSKKMPIKHAIRYLSMVEIL